MKSRSYPESIFGWERFKVGDIVTRDGTDLHRVTATSSDGQQINVVCIQAPSEPWCKIGDTESNLARRYSHAGQVIDVDPNP